MEYRSAERGAARMLARRQAGDLERRLWDEGSFAAARPFALYAWCEEPVAGGHTESTLKRSDAALTVGARGLLPILSPVQPGGEVRCGPLNPRTEAAGYWPEDDGTQVGATGMPFDACTRASCAGRNFSR
jgi:hypothetical protein